MTQEKADVVIFPKWKSSLEQDGLAALKEKNYKEALESFNKLIDFEAANSEIMTGKLICLMELGQYEEVEELCQKLMRDDEEHYFQYLHIYLTVLFQTGKYEELLDLLDEVFKSEDIPQDLRKQFWQLYDITENLRTDETRTENIEAVDELLIALDTHNVKKQWQLLSMLRKQDIQPFMTEIAPYLTKEDIEPVIKTALVQWMQEQRVDRKVTVKKLGAEIMVNPVELSDILSHTSARQLLYLLERVEQDNPTLFEFIQQLVFRYMYVRFPIMPEDHELPALAKAFYELGSSSLQLEDHEYPFHQYIEQEEVEAWKEQIVYYESQYFAVLDEE
ncbi:tetratricopeptide repeat protein [Pontibacillus sp. ALD_SL1]|uniref:tetratricopeptide repeat protein n=1 Tax=Pontibacillus sp. ALD_SL1 TaxID=2777185 RepID=UPI001A97721D|nr:tetratricopeptide repeat protein [Pontibacillus sp. ALD_SL1]QSS99141.1 tetratricopeptide repeat protein [Pontibacillus sp. ALD_SL1]